MRERDDEDLALEQLEHAQAAARDTVELASDPEAASGPEASLETEPPEQQPANATLEHEPAQEPRPVERRRAGRKRARGRVAARARWPSWPASARSWTGSKQALTDPALADARALAGVREQIDAVHAADATGAQTERLARPRRPGVPRPCARA